MDIALTNTEMVNSTNDQTLDKLHVTMVAQVTE